MSENIIKKATDYCEENKHRLTKPRLAVLNIINSSNKPLGAYDILDELGQVMHSPKPPTAYRAIDFWKEHGFIHRVESMNAYVICEEGHSHNGAQFMVCNDCGNVEEVHLSHLPKDLEKKVKSNGFKVDHWNAEISGQCEDCQ
ncbi:MAG: transcriptional repressor [Alphaproteobacteria bacterium]|nr:transcriptional repressor [Alphaproteobacteria bacterium]